MKIGVSECARWFGVSPACLGQILETGETPEHWDLTELLKRIKKVVISRKGLCQNPLYINREPPVVTISQLVDKTDELIYPCPGGEA